jgi:hypothetical protein
LSAKVIARSRSRRAHRRDRLGGERLAALIEMASRLKLGGDVPTTLFIGQRDGAKFK